MKFILAKKVNMTQIFQEDGAVQPATVLRVGDLTVSQIKNVAKDGYDAVQLDDSKNRKEFRVPDSIQFNKGDKISLEIFAIGDKVTVSAVSKGKGFQGVVKRHGFHGGPRSHGQKHSEREPGSIGGGGREGGKVIKGMRMAGRMGSDRVTVKNLKVVGLDKEKNLILISGAIPGRRGTLVEIRGNL